MKNLLTLFIILFSFAALAQDKIVKKNGEVINCTISELNSGEVKYFYEKNPKIIFGIDNALVDHVEFSTGEIVKIENNSLDNEDYYSEQGHHAVKANFLSPLFGSSEFMYEQNITPGSSWESGLGIVGLGFDTYEINARGVYGRFAYKFKRSPDFYVQKMHYSHIMKGAYVAPEFAIRYVKYDHDSYDYHTGQYETTRKENFAFAFTLKFGKQWVFNDSFLIDFFVGIGYGYSEDSYELMNYGFIAGSSDFPIAYTQGLRIGWVF